jgi:hypothetical protein
MKFYLGSLLFLLFLLSVSCKRQQVINTLIKRSWAVHEVTYNDSTYDFFFRGNTIRFNKDNTCKVPYFVTQFNEKAKWKIESKNQKNYLIIYDSNEEFLNGRYALNFKRENKYFIEVFFESDSLSFICRGER